ncbi:MAG: hypothetical protein IPG34_01525 [Rhodocyclaceae bacterium]|nr:hypothetical protein [Rhodocyclaceae bacterium]
MIDHIIAEADPVAKLGDHLMALALANGAQHITHGFVVINDGDFHGCAFLRLGAAEVQ